MANRIIASGIWFRLGGVSLAGCGLRSCMEATTDRAGKAYWDTAWGDEDWPPDIDPRAPKIWGHRDQIFHREIQQTIQDMTASRRDRRLSVLELGCARSAWLPYFVREFGCRVAGLDYSELGARQAAERLAALGISGEIRCADLFAPPADWIGSFDVVAWFGVVEHFEETTVAITAAARYLKPGGVIITEVPNLTGLNGWLQRTLHRPVYDIHVPLSAERLAQSHRDAGLDVLSSRYLVPTDFGVIDLAGHAPGASRTLKERALYPLRLLSGAIWWVDRRHGPLPTGRITSGFVMTVGRKAAPHG